MEPVQVLLALVALVAVATVVGLLVRRTTGRVRVRDGSTVISAVDLPDAAGLGSAATLLQFSTEVCAPCRATSRVLGGVADDVDGVAHIELDVAARPELADRFGILQTPTTLILDRSGAVRARIGGAPRLADLRAALDRVLADGRLARV